MSDEKNEVKFDASTLQLWRDVGEYPESLSNALDDILGLMEQKDGPQEGRLTVIVNNDLGIEDDEDDGDIEGTDDETITSKEG